MYPGNYNLEWHKYKDGEPMEEAPQVGSVARAWQWRERGINPRNQPSNRTVLENIAEDILVQKPLQITSCDLPGFPRSTFLMVFSPDGTKLASTHGNHNIYVSELASGKHVRILRGHPRTPWCVAFHPSHPQLIGSGCLGGQVRVWDISGGGSEVWNVLNQTVIASIAFHPRDQLLVIATFNELYFWDWSQPAPFTKVSTKNVNEKVRYVAFDSLGFKLITGISLWTRPVNPNSTSQNTPSNSSRGNGSNGNPGNGGPGNGGPDDNSLREVHPRLVPVGPDRPLSPDTPPLPPQDLIVNSYQNLVQRYDSLVRNYQRLFMVRHRLINTPPLANTIDRGTDPMETYPPISGRRSERQLEASATESHNLTSNLEPGTSQQQNPPVNDAPAPILHPDFMSLMDTALLDSATTRNALGIAALGFTGVPMPGLGHIGSASAFQPLSDERNTRIPPTLSSTNNDPQPNTENRPTQRIPDSEFVRRIREDNRRLTSSESDAESVPPSSEIVENLRHAFGRDSPLSPMPDMPDIPVINFSPPLPTEPPPANPPPPTGPEPPSFTSSTTRRRWNYTRDLDEPLDPTEEAQTINESLDLIRDILRDSGTRLLNLITNMSMNILSNSERDESARVPVHVFTGNLRRDFMASSSDSDTEYPEVNITRTPNATFRGWDDELIEMTRIPENTAVNRPLRNSNGPQISDQMTFEVEPESETPSRQGGINVSNRMTFELDQTAEVPSREGGINVSLSDERFRVRTQGSWAVNRNPQPTQDDSAPPAPSAPAATTDPRPGPSRAAPSPAPRTAARDEPQPGPSSAPDAPDPNQPSTSRGNVRPRNSDIAAQAFRRVKMGVFTLQKHTLTLANMWLRGDRTTLRELRTLWEDLRRRILALPTFYNRSLLERCMLLSELTEMPELLACPRPAASGRPSPRRSLRVRIQNRARSEETIRMRYERDRNPNEAGNGVARRARAPRSIRTSNSNTPSTSNTTTAGTSNSNTPSTSNTTSAGTLNANTPSTSNTTSTGALHSNTRRTSNTTTAGTLNSNTRRTSNPTTAGSLNSNTPSTSNTTLHSNTRRTSNRTSAGTLYSNTRRRSNTTTAGTLHTNTRRTSNTTTAGILNSNIPTTSNSNNPSTSNNAAARPSTSTESTNESRSSRAARAQRIQRRRVRLHQAYRWRGDSESRRRDVFPVRLSQLRLRSRTNLIRTLEQNATRHVIRTRAMKILSVMFNMMMMCLEERGLNQLIINMLKTLKKALALTCFMMMSNRNMPRDRPRDAPADQNVDSADVVRLQNVDHSEPINVDDNVEDPLTLRVMRYDPNADEPQPPVRTPNVVTSGTQTENSYHIEPLPSQEMSPANNPGMEWSHRLAVQIAAANRNTSSTANTRRDMYLETRRQKALHRTNPAAHPFVRRRFPPVRSHRIPALRTLPPELLYNRLTPRSPPVGPVAGPSNPLPRCFTETPPLGRDARENFIRLAHIRLRTAARNRFRRLQTIRLYTPSSVREMFALQDFHGENRAEEPAPPEAPEIEIGPRRAQFNALISREGLLRVNDLPPPAEDNGNPRLPRIHEYLQPIILAQNAMVVDEELEPMGGGIPPVGAPGHRRAAGMASFLDAGIITETLSAPSHRIQAWDVSGGTPPNIADLTQWWWISGVLVQGSITEPPPPTTDRVQAWDFTPKTAPDISDNTKNIVVQRCRIHNDASIDISKDGKLLVALLPAPRLRNTNNWLGEYHVGVYSLEWSSLGQCLHTAVLEQSAVSVALSPTARYLAVGLGSRRFTSSSQSRTNIIALLYKLEPSESTSRTGLSPMKELEQYWEHGFTSLNCLRWAPQPGQGLVYANNTGQLIIMS